MIDVKLDLSSINVSLDKFAEKVNKSAVRVGAQAAAQVFHDHAKANIKPSGKGHWFHGTSFKKTGQKYWFESGTLRNSIYQKFSEDNSRPGKATYHVAWNHKKCPYGFMVEFGTSRAAAKPFLRPAYESSKQQAYTQAVEKMRAFLATGQ